jgi:hypothetical protein
MWKEYRPFSKSSLTLRPVKHEGEQSIQKQQWHSREAQIEPPLIECECELLEYGRKSQRSAESRGFYPGTPVSSHRESWQGGLGKKGPQ